MTRDELQRLYDNCTRTERDVLRRKNGAES